MPRRRSPTKRQIRHRRLLVAVLLAPFFAYLGAALLGSLVPVNRGWTEPEQGTIIYLADNGIHLDLVMPVDAQGLDWAPLFPSRHFARPPEEARWIAFGAGERGIYLDTPRWRDLKAGTALRAAIGGERVIHVELLNGHSHAVRAIRLRPHEYRRLWAAVRADLRLDSLGRPMRIDHPGYASGDAFYLATGKISALRTCNAWVADKLRLAGVKTSLWPPFARGVTWRYRAVALEPPQR